MKWLLIGLISGFLTGLILNRLAAHLQEAADERKR